MAFDPTEACFEHGVHVQAEKFCQVDHLLGHVCEALGLEAV